MILYIYIHIYISVYKYICVWEYMYTSVCTCMCLYVCVVTSKFTTAYTCEILKRDFLAGEISGVRFDGVRIQRGHFLSRLNMSAVSVSKIKTLGYGKRASS